MNIKQGQILKGEGAVADIRVLIVNDEGAIYSYLDISGDHGDYLVYFRTFSELAKGWEIPKEDMNNTETFIDKAIKGGWKEHFYFSHFNENEVALNDDRHSAENNPNFYINLCEILLDPKAWEAVGKMLGWATQDDVSNKEDYRDKMHRFLDLLIEGETIEEALGKIMKN